MSNYTNNPFADALAPTPSEVNVSVSRRANASSPPSQQPRTYRSVPPPVNRATKDIPPPPSYEEVAGPEAVKAPYRDEKEPSRRSNGEHRSHGEHRSSHRHRSHSESEHHKSSSGRHHSSREYHSTSRGGEKSRHHSSRSGSGTSKSKSEKRSKDVPKPKNLDTIDKLDVTSLFGGGFHHDGPFEACTPFRNKDKKAAPVMAFPADGPNSSIKGAAQPIKEQLIDYAFGVPNDDDLYQKSKSSANVITKQISPPPTNNVYSNGQPSQSSATIRAIKNDASVYQFDAAAKAEPVHGQTTLGLGSSTFIDGAPAPKAAAIEDANQNMLSRKKSLVHRVKSMRRKN